MLIYIFVCFVTVSFAAALKKGQNQLIYQTVVLVPMRC